MWVGSMTLEYINLIMWVPWTKQDYLFIIHTFRPTLENLGGAILPTLFTWITVHPSKTWFIRVLFIKSIIHSKIHKRHTRCHLRNEDSWFLPISEALSYAIVEAYSTQITQYAFWVGKCENFSHAGGTVMFPAIINCSFAQRLTRPASASNLWGYIWSNTHHIIYP